MEFLKRNFITKIVEENTEMFDGIGMLTKNGKLKGNHFRLFYKLVQLVELSMMEGTNEFSFQFQYWTRSQGRYSLVEEYPYLEYMLRAFNITHHIHNTKKGGKESDELYVKLDFRKPVVKLIRNYLMKEE